MAVLDTAETRAAALLTSGFKSADAAAAAPQKPAIAPGAVAKPVRRFALDFALTLAVFCACVGVFNVDPGNAFTLPPPPDLSLASVLPPVSSTLLPAVASTGNAVGSSFSLGTGQFGLLAVALATLMATNLAIGRHLLSAYASPRRRTWGKGRSHPG